MLKEVVSTDLQSFFIQPLYSASFFLYLRKFRLFTTGALGYAMLCSVIKWSQKKYVLVLTYKEEQDRNKADCYWKTLIAF